VYAAVANLPPMTDALRGDIVACTSDGTLDVATVQTDLNSEPDTGVTATSGVAIYRVQFRTTRSTGADGYSSARIYLPLVPIADNPPVIVAAHGTEGLAATCATSMSATSMYDLALPWASLGYPVIAPDYAALGTPGTQGYLDNRDTARAVVDSVEALRKFVAGTLGRQVLIDGHSQGGGAALATQALATSMGLDGDLVAVLTFAPEYFSHMDSVGYVGSLQSAVASNPLTILTGVTKCEVATLIEYAYFANHVTSGPPSAGFPAAQASSLSSSIESQCTIPLGGAIQVDAPHVADWTDAELRGELLACIAGMDGGFGVDGGASCTGAGQAFYQYLQQNILPPDPTGAKVLLVQGLQDIVMPPDQEAACNVNVLEAGGVTPVVCTDATASHTNVVSRNIGFGIQWGQAALAGTPLPPCAASALPACSSP
jgi:pimeloyl-ACP methyl ester carboxylesterase